jgi:hypothetical protein
MDKFAIATEQLTDACDLFSRERFASALSLAGAAEEVLGSLLRERSATDGSKIKTALGERVDMIARLKGTSPEDKKEKEALVAFLNHPRNAAKHLVTEGPSRSFDIRDEAQDMIERALLNFRRVTGDFLDSPEVDSFRSKR